MDGRLADLLPAALRGEPIEPIAAGLSGAGVYRVGERHVLKVGGKADPRVLRAAAAAGIAPAVVHVAPGAVVSERIVDRGFVPYAFAQRAEAMTRLGAVLAKCHALAVDAPAHDLRTDLAGLAGRLGAVPAFVGETLAAVAVPAVHRRVLVHGDVNPTNLAWDGSRVVLLDWDAAALGDPAYDLGAACVFFRLDAAGREALLRGYGAPVEGLEDYRRYVAALCGAMFLVLAREHGHAGDAGATALDLGACYARMRDGSLSPATADGQFAFGLALIRESTTSR